MVSSPPPMGLHCFTPRLSQACSLPVSAQLRLSLVTPYRSKIWQAVPLKYLILSEIPRCKFRTFQCHTGCCCSRQGSVNTLQPWCCIPPEAPSLLSSHCHTTAQAGEGEPSQLEGLQASVSSPFPSACWKGATLHKEQPLHPHVSLRSSFALLEAVRLLEHQAPGPHRSFSSSCSQFCFPLPRATGSPSGDIWPPLLQVLWPRAKRSRAAGASLPNMVSGHPVLTQPRPASTLVLPAPRSDLFPVSPKTCTETDKSTETYKETDKSTYKW